MKARNYVDKLNILPTHQAPRSRQYPRTPGMCPPVPPVPPGLTSGPTGRPGGRNGFKFLTIITSQITLLTRSITISFVLKEANFLKLRLFCLL